jgi:hypothetical protein
VAAFLPVELKDVVFVQSQDRGIVAKKTPGRNWVGDIVETLRLQCFQIDTLNGGRGFDFFQA